MAWNSKYKNVILIWIDYSDDLYIIRLKVFKIMQEQSTYWKEISKCCQRGSTFSVIYHYLSNHSQYNKQRFPDIFSRLLCTYIHTYINHSKPFLNTLVSPLTSKFGFYYKTNVPNQIFGLMVSLSVFINCFLHWKWYITISHAHE